MLVFLDESEFISWHGTDLHVQSYRVKIYFSFWNDQEWRMCDQPENFKCYGHGRMFKRFRPGSAKLYSTFRISVN